MTKKNKYTFNKKGLNIILTGFLLAIGLIMAMPVFWMLSAAFKYESEIFDMPIQWIPNYLYLDNFKFILTEFPYIDWYFNTIKITIFIVVATIFVSSLAAYAFSRLEFKGKNLIFAIYIATLMIPLEVRIIPQFLFFKELHLIDTHTAIVLPWLFNGFAIFLLRQFFMSIPFELTESAQIDGCSEFRIFLQIILPLAKPAVMALTILSFTWSWNSYMPPLIYINSIDKQMISVGITTLKEQYVDNFGAQMAGASLALIPVIIVYIAVQKQFVEGIALTGIKG